MTHIERREPMGASGRREDDALDPAVLAGYEHWAGEVWRQRGKIAVLITFAGSLAGCVVGYLGRAHDLDGVKSVVAAQGVRLDKAEAAQAEHEKTDALNQRMLCSLVRRVDPPGVPAECGVPPKRSP